MKTSKCYFFSKIIEAAVPEAKFLGLKRYVHTSTWRASIQPKCVIQPIVEALFSLEVDSVTLPLAKLCLLDELEPCKLNKSFPFWKISIIAVMHTCSYTIWLCNLKFWKNIIAHNTLLGSCMRILLSAFIKYNPVVFGRPFREIVVTPKKGFLLGWLFLPHWSIPWFWISWCSLPFVLILVYFFFLFSVYFVLFCFYLPWNLCKNKLHPFLGLPIVCPYGITMHFVVAYIWH